MAYILKGIILLLFVFSSLDAGIHGHVFKILEEDFSDVLKSRVKNISEEEKKEIVKKQTRSLLNPSAVKGISEVFEYNKHRTSLRIKVKENIKDEKGNIIVKKGSEVNPLRHFSYKTKLIFIDGDNRLHIEWAKGLKGQIKWILIKGKPLEIQSEIDQAVYFDQLGLICKKLGIKRVPSLVSFENEEIIIEEIPVEGGMR